jgi:hypothetical protein
VATGVVKCKSLWGAGFGTRLRFDNPSHSPEAFPASFRLGRLRWTDYVWHAGGHHGYRGVAAGAGRSELKMSTITFQLPAACFFHTRTYLPRSMTGFPAGSCMVNS